jgi:hypothetical protein
MAALDASQPNAMSFSLKPDADVSVIKLEVVLWLSIVLSFWSDLITKIASVPETRELVAVPNALIPASSSVSYTRRPKYIGYRFGPAWVLT